MLYIMLHPYNLRKSQLQNQTTYW